MRQVTENVHHLRLQKGDTFLQRFFVIVEIIFELLGCDHFFVNVRALTTNATKRSSNYHLPPAGGLK